MGVFDTVDSWRLTRRSAQADHEARQASQGGRLAFNKRKLKAAPASAADPAGPGSAARSTQQTRRGGRGARRGGVRAKLGDDAPVGGAAPAGPAPKQVRRAMLSFGDDSDEGEAT